MLFIQNKKFARLTTEDQFLRVTEDLDNHYQILYHKLMRLLVNGSPDQLKKFAKKHKLKIDIDDAFDLFALAMDKSKFDNLMWFANFLNLNLEAFLKLYQGSHIDINNSFLSYLILSYADFEPNYYVMMNNLKSIGFNLNQKYEHGFTILHYAVRLNVPDINLHQDLVKGLLDNGANPNIQNDYKETVLKYANNEEIANYLIQQPECNPAFRYSKNSKSVVIKATEFKNRETYAYCLKHGGMEVAISRIERELIANTIPVARNSTMNNPAASRI